MLRFASEAFFIGLKEGLKLSLCLFLVAAYLRSRGRDPLMRPVYAGLAVVFLASFGAMNIEVTLGAREIVTRLVGYVFGLFFLFSLAALHDAPGTDARGPARSFLSRSGVLAPAVFVLTTVYFFPDMLGSSLYMTDLVPMSGGSRTMYVFAGSGFVLSLLSLLFLRTSRPFAVARLFGLPQLLLFLALVKMAAGGVRGFAELSLIPAVQAGLMKLVHDVTHQVLVLLMVPDHPILSVTAWNFIGVLFSQEAGMWLSLIVMLLPLALFIRRHFAGAVPVPADVQGGATRRKFIRAVRDDRVLKSLPVLLFMLFISASWFVQKGDSSAGLFIPDPEPVAESGGKVVIPLQSPALDLRDGMLHTFTIGSGGETMRILVIKRPDGGLAVCLDACEICPPDGYGQGREHVVCLYCNTPIPFDAVGKPGGCNPIPLEALVTDREVQIEIGEIAKKWALMKSGGALTEVGR